MNRTIAAGLLLALAGCTSRVPLSKELHEQLTTEDFQKLQCYVSQEIVLRRVLRSEERDVSPGHALRIEKDKRIEEIVIPAFTPGVVLNGKEDRLMVSFEPPVQGKELTLTFVLTHKWNVRGFYFLPDSEKNTVLSVSYGGKEYTCNNDSIWSYLMIDERRSSSKTKESRQLEGRRVGDGAPK